MAEDGGGPADQDRRDPARLSGERPVADGVHSAMQGMQPSAIQAMADRVAAEAQLEQLRAGDDAVLALGERPRASIDVDRRDARSAPMTRLSALSTGIARW